MIKKLRAATFSSKIIIVYIISLLLIITVVSFEQIDTSVSILESEKIDSLEMLTEHVAMNFAESQDTINSDIYARFRVFEIPGLMSKIIAAPNSGSVSLQIALAQTITNTSSYDFVILETSTGLRVSTPQHSRMTDEEYEKIYGRSNEILDGNTLSRYSKNACFGSDDGSEYVFKNVYNTSPLQWVGRAVVHMKPGFFSVSDAYVNTGFLFFDTEGNYLTCAGMQLEGEAAELIMTELDKGTEKDESSNYFVSQCSKNGWTTVGFSSKEVYRQIRGNIIRVGLGYGAAGLIVGITLMLILLRRLSFKLNAMKRSMARVAEGDLDCHIEITDDDDISQMASTFNYMTDRIHGLVEEVAEKERLKNDAEMQILEYKYRSLETQIRPHFIYNAFEIVNAMAKIKGETEIVEIVQRISRYFRNITVSTTRQFITTRQEFDALQDYTEIYRFIHGERLTVTFSAKEDASNAMIPTMIVQPIVENALKHGIRAAGDNSEIIVHAYVLDNRLNLTVKDTGIGLTPEQEYKLDHGEQVTDHHNGGIGLENVRQRLSLIYGNDAEFTIHNRPEGGVIVKIIIPLSYSEPMLKFEEDEWDFN